MLNFSFYLLANLVLVLQLAAEPFQAYVLDLSEANFSLLAISPAQGQEQFPCAIETVKAVDYGYQINHPGEAGGRLFYLLSLQTQSSGSWLHCETNNILTGMFAPRIVARATDDKVIFARALAAPLGADQWLFILGTSVQWDTEKLTRHLAAENMRLQLREELSNLYRANFQAMNARAPKAPQWGYARFSAQSELDLGNPAQEIAFALKTIGNPQRCLQAHSLPPAANYYDDGFAFKNGEGLRFTADLQQLALDDLYIIIRYSGAGSGKLLVDGLDLKSWDIPKQTAGKDVWQHLVLNIANRLVEDKSVSQFEIQVNESLDFSIFTLWLLRSPAGRGSFVNQLLNKQDSTDSQPLIVGEHRFLNGLRQQTPDIIKIPLHGEYLRFESLIGVDQAATQDELIIFSVEVDGKLVYKSKPLSKADNLQSVYAPVNEAQEMVLSAQRADGNNLAMHADWVEAMLVK